MGLKTFWHKLGSPRWFYGIANPWRVGFGLAAALLLSVGLVWALVYAPPDYQQGNAFRIFYIHVPSAMIAQSIYIGMGVAGLVLFVWRMKLADVAIAACLPVGMTMTALALFSGGVWGKPTWGTWWEWDGRTVSTLVLLFLYIGIYALRQAIMDPELRGKASALLAIVGTINIPIIKYSVDWWATLHQPATFTLTEKPAMPPEMYLPALVMALGLYSFVGYVILQRMQGLVLEREARTSWVRELAG
ncbi:MAG: heme ABC transporter permease CcmC [Pseudomonadota bacterium]